MIRWLTLALHLAVAGLKSRQSLLLEMLALRHQLLSLPCAFTPASPSRTGQARSVGDILRAVVEGGAV
jgi:hypothetical protein